jgi:hypothetical protein
VITFSCEARNEKEEDKEKEEEKAKKGRLLRLL